nr:MAG TPA: hypothetical protein [Caudoviricetes sp.]
MLTAWAFLLRKTMKRKKQNETCMKCVWNNFKKCGKMFCVLSRCIKKPNETI